MTARDIYVLALSILSQRIGDNPRWDELAPDWINVLLAEFMPAESTLREYDGLPILWNPPTVEELTDKIPYHTSLKAALVNALASLLWTDADDGSKAQDYRNRAGDALNAVLHIKPEAVKDVYRYED